MMMQYANPISSSGIYTNKSSRLNKIAKDTSFASLNKPNQRSFNVQNCHSTTPNIKHSTIDNQTASFSNTVRDALEHNNSPSQDFGIDLDEFMNQRS